MTFSAFLRAGAAAACLSLCAAAPASAQGAISVDYSAWSDLLSDIVYDVGFSDRQPAIGIGPQRTGTRIRVGSTSRYRYEGNRVIYHLIDDERRTAISAYREELAALPQQIDLSRLSPDGELAYWLNLHNVIVIDEIMNDYPMSRVDSPFSDNPRSLFNKPVVQIDGRALSLNQIRRDIVYARWPDPRVMYGFHFGSVGGPTIRSEAFNGQVIWTQLNRSAREFVNALRGVENHTNKLSISELYLDSRALFPSWPADLHAHLLELGDSDVDAVVASRRDPVPVRYDRSIADMTDGARCGAPGGGALNVQSAGRSGRISVSGGCEILPPQALDLVRNVQIRQLRMLREGRRGTVTIRDLPTVDEPEAETEAQPNGR